MKKNLYKIGFGGTLFCCLAKSSLIALLASLGVAISFKVFIPVFSLFLLILFIALVDSYSDHHNIGPLSLAFLGTFVMLVFLFVVDIRYLAYFGVGLIVLSGVWDIHQTKGCPSHCRFNKK